MGNGILDNFRVLADKEEYLLVEKKYTGKAVFNGNKYKQQVEGLIRTRLVMFLSFILLIVLFLLSLGQILAFGLAGLIVLLSLPLLILVSTIMFNQFRMLSISLSSLILLFDTSQHFLLGNMKTGALFGALLVLVVLGSYHHFQLKKYRDLIRKNENVI